MDVALALVLLTISLPVLLLVALAIKLETPGPVLFRQPRHGYNDDVFGILKFRTMHANLSDAGGRMQTRANDPRVTRVGALLRRHSLDELPQLLNVLRGDMSLVGPRPHSLETCVNGVLLYDLLANYGARHRMRPGLTGLAQISGLRGELDRVEKAHARLRFDLEYIKNWSLWLDVQILVATIRCVLRGDDCAY
jgi:lipopolysaccharide/colanic/teichoic acid biosynthesis glycosyltransferase